MTRYEECLAHVRAYVRELTQAGVRPGIVEDRVRSFVEQPAYDVTYRRQLIDDALGKGVRP